MNKTNLRYITSIALLVALAVSLKVLVRIPLVAFGGMVKDINPSPALIMYAGIAFGPLAGGIVGALVDFFAWLIAPMGAYMPLYTITNALMRIIPALFFMSDRAKKLSTFNYKETSEKVKTYARVCIAVLVSHIICSSLLNTIITILLYGSTTAWIRAAANLITMPIYCVITCVLYRATTRIHVPVRASRRTA